MVPGIPTTPRVLLEKVMERTGEISNLVVIEQDTDGRVHIYNTVMSLGDAVWMESEFRRRFDSEVMG
jgi:hypothetical protein